MVRVSVIVSNYNYGKYLNKSLGSVLGQDFPAEQMEILLIDDASTDPVTREFVQKYDHPRVRKILLEENVGVVQARNLAIEQALGEYIIPLDADDWFEKDYIRLAAQTLDDNPDVALVYALGELVGDAFGQWLQPFDMETVLLEGGTPPGSMYRKKAWEKVGGYQEYMKNGWEDWDFWLCFLDQGYRIQAITETVGFYYRIKRHSRSTDHASKHLAELWKNLYSHHQELYQQYPEVLVKVLIQASHGRVLMRSLEYRIGHRIANIIRTILGPVFPLIMRWKARLSHKSRESKNA